MAIQAGQKPTVQDIRNQFVSTVLDVVLNDTYHKTRVPSEGGYQCVPSDIMDSSESFNNVLNELMTGNPMAADLYNQLIAFTTALTRVGTFSWVRYYKISGYSSSRKTNGNSVVGSISGKCIFTDDKARTLATVDNPGVNVGEVITAQNLIQLLDNCFTAWNNTSKFHYSNSVVECHDICYGDCYSDCHGDCNSSCYSDNGYCWGSIWP